MEYGSQARRLFFLGMFTMLHYCLLSSIITETFNTILSQMFSVLTFCFSPFWETLGSVLSSWGSSIQSNNGRIVTKFSKRHEWMYFKSQDNPKQDTLELTSRNIIIKLLKTKNKGKKMLKIMREKNSGKSIWITGLIRRRPEGVQCFSSAEGKELLTSNPILGKQSLGTKEKSRQT